MTQSIEQQTYEFFIDQTLRLRRNMENMQIKGYLRQADAIKASMYVSEWRAKRAKRDLDLLEGRTPESSSSEQSIQRMIDDARRPRIYGADGEIPFEKPPARPDADAPYRDSAQDDEVGY